MWSRSAPMGRACGGRYSRYFQSDNRYRDTAVSPDGKTIYIATDPDSLAEAMAGGTTRTMASKGSILAFTYLGEGTGAAVEPQRTTTAAPAKPAPAAAGAAPATYTATQAARGKTAFDADCAVCHGNTLRNGTMGPPLAGEAFHTAWAGRSVRALSDSAKTMPPANPGSLSDETYTSIIAYVLQVNGYAAGRDGTHDGRRDDAALALLLLSRLRTTTDRNGIPAVGSNLRLRQLQVGVKVIF